MTLDIHIGGEMAGISKLQTDCVRLMNVIKNVDRSIRGAFTQLRSELRQTQLQTLTTQCDDLRESLTQPMIIDVELRGKANPTVALSSGDRSAPVLSEEGAGAEKSTQSLQALASGLQTVQVNFNTLNQVSISSTEQLYQQAHACAEVNNQMVAMAGAGEQLSGFQKGANQMHESLYYLFGDVGIWMNGVIDFVGSLGNFFVAIETLIALTNGATIGQTLFNVALYTCPITWIVAGIMATIAVIAIAWNKFEGFRKVVLGVWEVIKEFGKTLWESLLPALEGIARGILAIFQWKVGDVWGALKSFKEYITKSFKATPVGVILNTDIEGAWEKGKQKGSDSWAKSEKEKKEREQNLPGLIPDLNELTASTQSLIPNVQQSLIGNTHGLKGLNLQVGNPSATIVIANNTAPAADRAEEKPEEPNHRGNGLYSAIASKLSPLKTASLTAAASLAMPALMASTVLPQANTLEASTLPLSSSVALSERDPLMGSSSGGVSMGKFCETLQIHIASADGKGYDQIQQEITDVLKQVFDDYGA